MFSLSAFELTPARAPDHEWLLSNGIGGYSSSTAIGMNSRKYHGLLVAPLKGVHGRHVLLSKVEETVRMDGQEFQVSTNAYPGRIFPEGFRRQVGFSFSDHPLFTYAAGGVRLEKSVRMLHGKNAVVISYRLAGGRRAELVVRPLLFPRPIHSDPDAQDKLLKFESDRFGFELQSPGMRMCTSAGKFVSSPENYRNMVYPVEQERGYPFVETLFSPGEFCAGLETGDELHLVASLEGLAPSEALDLLDGSARRFAHLAEGCVRASGVGRTDFSDALLRAADSFVVLAGRHRGIIAGFPWFSEWGRDAAIALPGLLLATGRFALAREVLLTLANGMEEGLLPNFIDENGEAHYESADASLWFLNAIRQYVDWTGDEKFVQQELWKPMRAILSSCVQGNRLVAMDDDCLLAVKEQGATWMDARIGGKAVTPRKGKPVEVNALWHSGLVFMAQLAEKSGDRRTAMLCGQLSQNSGEAFQKFFSAEDGLFDVLEPNDSSLRPNQIFAVSLPHSPLNEIQKRHVFHIVRSRLYTQLGLRSLAPDDPHFHGTYGGNQEKRDSAYHQGAIWPWLLGAFYDAQLAVYPGSERQVLAALRPVADAMQNGCVGTLPELYEPATMRPVGAISQAWSVAEVLRIYVTVKKRAALAQEEKIEKAGMLV